MNRASLDRGFGRCIVLRKYGTSLKKYANRTQDRIVLPAAATPASATRPTKFRILDRDGIAAAGEVLTQGECLWLSCLALVQVACSVLNSHFFGMCR